MRISWEPSRRSRAMELLTGGVDFSIFTLNELFTARHWIDAANNAARNRVLEKEIHRRCSYIRARIDRPPSVVAKSDDRFRPYGFIFGLVALFCSIGPFLAVEFFDMIYISRDPGVDSMTLSGVWAVATSIFAAMAFLLGGIMDAGRVVEWFNLAGRQAVDRIRLRRRIALGRAVLDALRLG